MAVRLRFFGTAGYELVTSSGTRLLIDPYLDSNPVSPVKAANLEPPDLILVTHLAYDHFGDTAAIAKASDCIVVGAKDVAHCLTKVHGLDPERIRVTIWGLRMEVAGVSVQPVASHHWSFGVTPAGELLSGPAVGYVIDAGDGVRIYHPGDSAITYDMKLWGELYRPTVGLMHVALPEASLPHMECYLGGELSVYEAVLASGWLGLQHVITSHYQSPEHPDVQAFRRLMDDAGEARGRATRVTLLAPGDVIEL